MTRQRVRFSPAFDLRAAGGDGRTIEGTALTYGSVAVLPWGRERFEARAFEDLAAADVILNRQHDRRAPLARTGGGGLELLDAPDALRIRATLPDTREAQDVLALIAAGVLRGLSIEFASIRSRIVDGIAVVSRAALGGVAVVDRPAYPDSLIARERAAFEALAGGPDRRGVRLWL